MPGSTHLALFCIRLLSSAGCRLPGVLAAQPAPLGLGGASCCRQGEAGMMFPSLGRARVMAVLLQAWSTGGASAFK